MKLGKKWERIFICQDCGHKIIEVNASAWRRCPKCRKRMVDVDRTPYHPKVMISYFDGGKEKTISKGQLEEIKSGVRTHDGEFLSGKKGRKYLDKYSKSKMGKDLSGSYNA